MPSLGNEFLKLFYLKNILSQTTPNLALTENNPYFLDHSAISALTFEQRPYRSFTFDSNRIALKQPYNAHVPRATEAKFDHHNTVLSPTRPTEPITTIEPYD